MAEHPKPLRTMGGAIRPAVGSGPAVRRPGWSAQTQTTNARSARPGRTAAAAAAGKPDARVEVDDHYLLALAKQGSPDAYERLVRRYHSFVRLKASSYFLVGGDSEDLIQEGLVGLYKAIRDFRSDRESSFRNFAELCITRQIITAVKTATRNKHTPLNGYVSFSASPAGTQGEGDATLDEVLAGASVWDPVNQVISSEELSSLVGCLSTALSELESRVLSLYLDGRSYVEIGELIGCDAKTVDNALQRVKRKVMVHLKEREQGPQPQVARPARRAA